jgi:hypothetical protein
VLRFFIADIPPEAGILISLVSAKQFEVVIMEIITIKKMALNALLIENMCLSS